MSTPRIVAVLALSLPVFAGPPAWATHDGPRKAASIKADLVRAHAACTSPNDVHDRVAVFASACSPAAPLSAYTFGPQGQGNVQIQLVGAGVKLRFDVKDVRSATDTPADGVSFAGRVHLRITDDGCSAAASCTVETFLNVEVGCSKGRCFANKLYPDVFLPVGLGGAAEVTQIDVLDDAGGRFATAGILLH